MLFTFPSRYSCTIGLTGVFSLAGWSRRIHTGFHVPRATQDPAMPDFSFGYGALTPCGATFQRLPLAVSVQDVAVLLPRGGVATARGLGCSPFARHYWGNHCCFLFLEVLRCFSSLRSPPHLCADDRPPGGRVFPFGDPGVIRSLAPNPGLSQLVASFIASMSQGIRHAPFFTFLAATHIHDGRAGAYLQSFSRDISRSPVIYSLACPTCQRSYAEGERASAGWRITDSNR